MSNTQASSIEAGFQPERSPSIWTGLLSLAGLTLLLSVVGAGIATYLTYVHYDEAALVCSTGGCETVQQSQYSTIGPIPIAALGLGMFIVLAGLALVRVVGWTSLLSADNANFAAWGITLTALLYYAYLVYVELFVLDAICQWCVGTTIATVGIFAVESLALRKSLAIDDDDLIDE